MPNLSEYYLPLEVRSYDADAWNELPDSMLLHMLEHLAWAASAVAGFDMAWYENHNSAWVIRRMTLARLQPIHFGDQLVGRTWISDVRRVRSNRDYELRFANSEDVLVSARADWVYVDRLAQRPIAVDPAIAALVELYAPATQLDPLPLTEPLTGRVFSSQRRAARSEADSMGHVNNANYIGWLEEALSDALIAAGVELAIPGRPGPRLVTTHLALDYLQSARPGDQIEISTRLVGATNSPDILAWDQQITRATDRLEIMRCASQRRLLVGDPALWVSKLVM